MSNDERMTNDEARMTKPQPHRHSGFVILSAFVIGHSSLGAMGIVASTKRAAMPETKKAAAQARKTACQPCASASAFRARGDTAAPMLPHMLPQPRTEPTCRPPTSCMKAHRDGVPRSTEKETMASRATMDQGESRLRHTK